MNDNRFDSFGGNQPFNERQSFTGNQSFNDTPPFNGFQSTVTDANYGKGDATTSLVLGIISVVCLFFGYSVIVSIILGIIGLIFASKSKSKNYYGSTRTAGYILSLIGLIGGGLIIVVRIFVLGILGSMGINLFRDILQYV